MKDSRKLGELVYAMVEYKCKTFVETGTYMGDKMGFFRHFFENLYSIEIRQDYFLQARHRFKECSNVHLIHGDSAIELPWCIWQVKSGHAQEPVLFWLDAHGEGWKGPVLEELEAIKKSGIQGVTLVDDVGLITDELPRPYELIDAVARYIHVG